MNKKVRTFFENKGLETHKLIEKNRAGFKREQIEHGMKRVYSRLQMGEVIKDIAIAREVWAEAETHKGKHHRDIELELEEEKIQELTQQRDDYKGKFYACLILSAAFLYTVFAVQFIK